MGKLMDEEWTNRQYHLQRTLYSSPPEKMPWYPVWNWLASQVGNNTNIVDLGCGAGQFLYELNKNKNLINIKYIGYDYSPIAIEMARILNNKTRIPHEFYISDITCLNKDFNKNNLFIMSEVLEHLKDDLSLIKKLPRGARLLGSVPDFDSPGHVRLFTKGTDVLSYYRDFLDITVLERQQLGAISIWTFVSEIR